MGQTIRDEVIEELLRGYSGPEDLLGEEGLFKQLKKKLLERALGAELTEHLGYEKGDPAGRGGILPARSVEQMARFIFRESPALVPVVTENPLFLVMLT